MLRLTELKLPLDHTQSDLKAAVLKRLRIAAQDLIDFTVFRRATDARKKSNITLTYTLDIDVRNEGGRARTPDPGPQHFANTRLCAIALWRVRPNNRAAPSLSAQDHVASWLR